MRQGANIGLSGQNGPHNIRIHFLVSAIVVAISIWSYWPTLVEMQAAWEHESDYSHGYLVAPLCVAFAYVRRTSFPGTQKPAWLLGLTLISLSMLMRWVGAAYFVETVDGWSIMFWLAGVVSILFGWPVTRWAAPVILFLVFMMPLPYRAESFLSQPLQRVATTISCYGLQLFGQPAIAEGNVILVGDNRLEVAAACSGLRLFVSIVALASAYLILVERTWWEKSLLLLAIIPIAVFTNALRIVATGLLQQLTTSEIAGRFSHDFAGFVMIPVAAVSFWAFLWYLRKAFPERIQLSVGEIARDAQR